MVRILGIDYGERRIGLALSDTLNIMAHGLPTIDTRKTPDFIDYIKNIVDKNNVEKIVVGLPKNMNGSIGEKGKKVLEFIEKLNQIIKIPTISWDERLTSRQSERIGRDLGNKPSKHKEKIDKMAATLLLQSYLDHLSHSLGKENET